MRQWPPVKSAVSTRSSASSWPTMTLCNSVRIRSRPAMTRSATCPAVVESIAYRSWVGCADVDGGPCQWVSAYTISLMIMRYALAVYCT